MKGRVIMTLAETLKRIRKKYKMTQEEVSQFLGVSRSGYTYYETGKTVPSVDTLKKLAVMYDTTVDEIIGLPPKNSSGRKVSEDNISAKGVDPLMYMKKEEQSLIMAFRLASKENKEKIIKEVFALSNSENVE